MLSSARRILKRGGQELQKIWEQRSELEIVPLKFSPIFRPKLGEEQKKAQSLKENAQDIPFVWSNLMPNLQRGGGGGSASILLTFLCNFTILAT